MSSNLLKKGDPRVARLVDSRRRGDEAGYAATVIGDGGASPVETVELLVTLNSEDVPSQLQHETWKWRRLAGRLYSVTLPMSEVAEIHDSPSVRGFELPRPIMPFVRQALEATRIDELHTTLSRRGNNVVVGIVDFGLDFTLSDFVDEDGESRVAFLWDQTLTPKPRVEKTPDDYDYGVEYRGARITEALKHDNPFEKVRHKPQPYSHGTHVAGIAAGNGRGARHNGRSYCGAAPEATIVFVQPRVDTGTSVISTTNSARLVDAVTYIFERARRLKMPCVVNISLGHYGTGHDGETSLERAIDYLLQDRGRAVVVAAGNAGAMRTHQEWQFIGGASVDMQWSVPAQSGGVYHEAELWFPSRAEVTVQLRSPGGEVSNVILASTDNPSFKLQDNEVFITSQRFDPFNGDSRIYIWLSRGDAPDVAAGTWTIHLEAKSAEPGVLHAWIERVVGPDAAQSTFSDSASPAVTLGAPATSRYCLAVGNWNAGDEKSHESSSSGPTRDGRPKPEIVAPGTAIVSCHALAGRDSGNGVWPNTVEKTGTSMSAPLVAGLVACLFEENRQLTAPQVTKILMASAQSAAGSTGYRPDTGFGVVDGAKALSLVRKYIV
jgi:subtilisin family serine protease